MANPAKKLIYIAGQSGSSNDEDDDEEIFEDTSVGGRLGPVAFGNGHASKESQGSPPNQNPIVDEPNERETSSFWWIRKREKDLAAGGQSTPEAWRLSKSSMSTIYHSAEDFADLMSDTMSNNSDSNQRPGHHGDSELEDIFSSPPDSPVQGRKTGKTVAFALNHRTMPLKDIDFVLVWDGSNEICFSEESKEKRRIFERNLEEEGLVLEREKMDGNEYNFVKIHAPIEVLKRYSEILKIRMPMKELHDDVVERIYSGSPEFQMTQVPQIREKLGTVVQRVKGVFSCFELDRRLFPKKESRLTAVYSRDKEYLFNVDDSEFFTDTVRARVVDFVLSRKRYTENNYDDFAFGIERLKRAQVYTASYPLHQGDLKTPGTMRYLLKTEWAAVRKGLKYQPLDEVMEYFGVKVGLYFAWLGFYTHLLIPASIVGLACFLYGCFTLYSNQQSEDICNMNITMCPLCDKLCDYYEIKDTCTYSRLTYLFDNNATVFFTVLMSFWTAIYLEMWKRYAAKLAYKWDVSGFDIHEEHPREEYLARLKNIKTITQNSITARTEPRVPFWKMRLPYTMFSLSMVLFLISMAIAATVAVVFFRISSLIIFYQFAKEQHNPYIYSYSLIVLNSCAACVNLIFIFFFNWLYSFLAVYLTELEFNRTQTQFDDSVTLKMYLLQFINYYSSIFYIAFFKGKFVGRPGKYTKFLGYRQEECGPGGCMTELCIQLAIILIGKQILNMGTEMLWPIAMKKWNNLKLMGGKKNDEKETVFNTQWAKDLKLLEWGSNSLFQEYLEMVLQYGFVTIFVAAFPLAPLFALLNNILEMRMDAKKLITYYRRPVSQRVKDIGIWYGIMDCVGKLAVISNAFIIAFTSNFIPKMVYKYGQHEINPNRTLHGFLNHSLAYFNTSDEDYVLHSSPSPENMNPMYLNITECRYQGYRTHYSLPEHEKYKRTDFYWQVWMARLCFVVVFENFVAVAVIILRWMIPDVPSKIREKIRREAYLTNEIIIKKEMLRSLGIDSAGDSSAWDPVAGERDLDFVRSNSTTRNRRKVDTDSESAEVMV